MIYDLTWSCFSQKQQQDLLHMWLYVRHDVFVRKVTYYVICDVTWSCVKWLFCIWRDVWSAKWLNVLLHLSTRAEAPFSYVTLCESWRVCVWRRVLRDMWFTWACISQEEQRHLLLINHLCVSWLDLTWYVIWTSYVTCDERDPASLKNTYTIPCSYLTLCVSWLDLTWYVLLTS